MYDPPTGRAPSGSGDASVNPEAQVNAFMKFNGPMLAQGVKRRMTFHVGRRLNEYALRARTAAESTFAPSTHIAVSLDGSRVGGRDLMVGVVAALVDGSGMAFWAPPQAVARSHL